MSSTLITNEGNLNLYQKPLVEYNYNKLPKEINLIILEPPVNQKYKSTLSGFLSNYFLNADIHKPTLNFINLESEEDGYFNCQNYIKNSTYTILIDASNSSSQLKEECFKKITKENGLFISLYTSTIVKQRAGKYIFFNYQEDTLKFLKNFKKNNFKNTILLKDTSNSIVEKLSETLDINFINISLIDYSSSYEKLISEKLLLNESNKRKKLLSYTISTELGFIPRRRNDIDSIIIFSSIDKMKAIKPAISYNFSEDLDIFYINTDKLNYQFNYNDKDFDGMTMIDFPFNIIHDGRKEISTNRNLLFSIGYDAYEIYLLTNDPTTKSYYNYSGLTGNFYIRNTKEIKRESPIISIKNGKIKPVNYP